MTTDAGIISLRLLDDGKVLATVPDADRYEIATEYLDSTDHPYITRDRDQITLTASNGTWRFRVTLVTARLVTAVLDDPEP